MKVKSRYVPVIFGLTLLFIPSVNIVDVFPDFIAYFIFAAALAYGVNKVPYFEEARDAFMRLGLICLLRIPAMLIMNFVRMGNRGDSDIFAMMTLVFGIIETIYLIPAISSFFDAMFYLGSRSDARSMLAPIKLFGHKVELNTVKETGYFFAVARAVLALLPELCLMCAEDTNGSGLIVHPYAHLYPAVFGICFPLSLIIGIVFFIMMAKYIRAIHKEGLYHSAIDSLVTEERRPEIERKLKLKNMCAAINTMMVATVFTLDINFDNFGNVNILPHFIFAITLVFGLSRLTGRTRYTKIASLLSAAYSVVSLVAHAMLIAFLEDWSYTEIKLVEAARSAYTPILILSAIEFIFAVALIVTVMLALREFTNNNTKIPPTSERYAAPDRDFHRSMFRRNLLVAVFGILVTGSKLALAFLNGGADYLVVGSIDGDVTTIVTTAIPWFGLLITILACLYAGSAFYFFGILKDELKMKYQ